MNEKQKIAVLYHEIFDYKLNKHDLKKWEAGEKLVLRKGKVKASVKLTKRKVKMEVSPEEQGKKMEIARRAGRALSYIPTVFFVGVTGSLAMNNAKKESDIDLMVITKENSLWITRMFAFLFLSLLGFSLRRANNKNEQDKLCLNFWIDERELSWSEPKNAYTAHEIAQVRVIVDRGRTYHRWIVENLWIKEYWPNSIEVKNELREVKREGTLFEFALVLVNSIVFKLQYLYMRNKLTRESVSLHHAYFHPFDWGNKVINTLEKNGVFQV